MVPVPGGPSGLKLPTSNGGPCRGGVSARGRAFAGKESEGEGRSREVRKWGLW